MLLGNLNERQKQLFKDISIFVAYANGSFDEEEKNTVAAYCSEMDIPYSEDTTTDNIDEAMSEIVDISTEVEKRIIAFELIGLAYADGVYHEEERECIEKFSAKAGISATDLEKIDKLVEKVIDVNNEVIKLIMTS